MKKEYIIGGLALLGIIGVVSYLRKPKRNSDGFFNAGGRVLPIKEPIVSNETCNLPDTFVKRVFTDGGLKSYCGRYDRLRQGNKPFLYRLQRDLSSDFVGVRFYNGNFYNSNNQIIGTNPPTLISYVDFENAFRTGQNC
jgi:hypothetical protein